MYSHLPFLTTSGETLFASYREAREADFKTLSGNFTMKQHMDTISLATFKLRVTGDGALVKNLAIKLELMNYLGWQLSNDKKHLIREGDDPKDAECILLPNFKFLEHLSIVGRADKQMQKKHLGILKKAASQVPGFQMPVVVYVGGIVEELKDNDDDSNQESNGKPDEKPDESGNSDNSDNSGHAGGGAHSNTGGSNGNENGDFEGNDEQGNEGHQGDNTNEESENDKDTQEYQAAIQRSINQGLMGVIEAIIKEEESNEDDVE
jgi:hypothetical protein